MSIAVVPLFEPRPYTGEVWRLVEGQAPASTVRLTDSLAEQARLEALLDGSKPLWPDGCRGLDFLLATPFRYWPYPNGSRFRRAGQPEGVFYASEAVSSAVAEMAFYRQLFFLEAPGALRPAVPMEMTAFSARIKTNLGIDLTSAALADNAAHWQHPTDYEACQTLADQARAASVALIRYQSIRCPAAGKNIALLTPAGFADKGPRQRQTWHLFLREASVQAWCECPNLRLEFQISQWAAGDARLRGSGMTVPSVTGDTRTQD